MRLQCRLNLPDFKFRREFNDVRGSWYRDTDNGEDEDGDEDEDREEDEMDYDDGLDFGDDLLEEFDLDGEPLTWY